ncbi:MAG TPA: shikimate kinase [Ornithinibacter sp.]|nr:shikimate kinase [Ornithinibacter sp.]
MAIHVVVIGAMASGKSSVGRGLADRLARPLRDSDDDLRADLGISGRELAAAEGVEALHSWEVGHLLRALRGTSPSVVAAAASTVDHEACRAALGDHVVIWLAAPPSVLAARRTGTGPPDHRRDVAGGEGDLARRRAATYRAAADIVVDMADATVDEVVAAVLAQLPATVLPDAT